MSSSIGENLIILVMVIWSVFWKCYSVWTAVKRNDKRWFIALVILNTAGILDMIYIFGVAKKSTSDVKNVLKKVLKTK